jgi:hypothetical protein
VEMLDECRLRLSEGHLKAALLIWKRHQVRYLQITKEFWFYWS